MKLDRVNLHLMTAIDLGQASSGGPAAVDGAARLLESGWGQGLNPEERLRRAIAACALERPDVLEVRIRPEWKPAMKL